MTISGPVHKPKREEFESTACHFIYRWTSVEKNTSWLGAGSQEVHHIQMVPNVVEDFQFSHQSLVFTGCGSL